VFVIPFGNVMEVSEICKIEILNHGIWEKVFPFSFYPGFSANKDVFTIVDLPYEPVLDQGEFFYIGLPND
jgi:hypothetical protein